MNRHAFAGAMIAVTALLLSACGTPASDPTTSDPASNVTAGGGDALAADLVWEMWVAGTEDQAEWQKVGDAVTDKYPDINVTLQGTGWNDYFTRLLTRLPEADPPCIAGMQSLRMPNYVDDLLPLDDLAAADGLDLSKFDPAALEGMSIDGSLYGLPYDTGPILMFYNQDMFKQAGVALPEPGWTVEDFEAAGEKFAAAGMKLFAPPTSLFLESTILAYNGGRVLTENGDIDATDANFAAGLDWMGSLYQKGWTTEPASAASISSDQDDFIAGRAASYAAGPWMLLPLLKNVDFTVGATTLPTGTGQTATFSAGSGFVVARNCQNPEAAFAAVSVMTGEEVLTELASSGRAFPGRTASQSAWVEVASDVTNISETLDAARDTALPLPGNPKSDNLDSLLARYAPDAMTGARSGEAVMADIAAQLD